MYNKVSVTFLYLKITVVLIHSTFYIFQPVTMVFSYTQLGDSIYIWIFDTVKQDSVLFSQLQVNHPFLWSDKSTSFNCIIECVANNNA